MSIEDPEWPASSADPSSADPSSADPSSADPFSADPFSADPAGAPRPEAPPPERAEAVESLAAAVDELDRLSGQPAHTHAARYHEVHTLLQDALSDTDR